MLSLPLQVLKLKKPVPHPEVFLIRMAEDCFRECPSPPFTHLLLLLLSFPHHASPISFSPADAPSPLLLCV